VRGSLRFFLFKNSLMKFALVGDDPVVLPLVRVLAEHPEHRLLAAALLGGLEADVLRQVPAVRLVSGWEELIPADLDAVIVCGSAEVIGEAARQLAAAGRPLVVFPQGAWDTELVYELSLVRDDNAVSLVPIGPRWLHPVFREFQKPLASSRAGDAPAISHLRWEWDVEAKPGGGLPASVIRSYLLPDVSLLRILGGEYHQVTAVESATRTGGIVLATVTLTGENLPDAVWSLKPVNSPSRWKLTVTHSAGTTTFEGSADPWEIVSSSLSNAPVTLDEGHVLLEFIERRLSTPDERPDWTDLTRDFEVLDAVRRSLARRRTIDLHFETTSERSLFKTQMTAIGCGVLMLTLFAVVVLLFLGSVLDARSPSEIAADKADTIFYREEFEPSSEKLTQAGRDHWDRVARARQDPAMLPILVELVDEETLSAVRREHLVRMLKAEGIPNADQRVEVHALNGPWFKTLMKIARILVFLPLFLFLGLQMLLLITRPAQAHRKTEKIA
jgi:hypothetical protein